MSFLSRRVNQGPRGAWAKNTWFLQTSNWSFRLSSNPKKKTKKTKKTKQSEKKNPQATHAIKGSTGLIWKVSKSHLEKKPWDALSTPNVGLNQSRLQALPHERTCAKYFFHELPLGPKDLNQIEEKDKEIPLYGHRHIKGRSNMCSVKPLCFNMKWTKLRIQLKY